MIFLTPLGVQAEQAVALGLLLYLLNLAVSLVGAPAFALGTRHRPKARSLDPTPDSAPDPDPDPDARP